MAATRKNDGGTGRPEPVPPGATQAASDRTSRPGGPPATDLVDIYAAGTPGGGTEFGGLAGSNAGDGAPENELHEMQAAEANGDYNSEAQEATPPYSGLSGGAVGGTPAEDRATGGQTGGGLAPGGVHRGDSTVGADPDKG